MNNEWSEKKYGVKVEHIDNQHKYLFDCIDNLDNITLVNIDKLASVGSMALSSY